MKNRILTLLGAAVLVSSLVLTSLNASSVKSAKPFLIQGKLPHLTGMVKILWDDEDLALTADQQKKLIEVRKSTMSRAKALGKQVNALESKIVEASQKGATPKSLKADVEKLAALRAQATMVHLECIYNTREILSDEQLYVLE